jgi:hypothetical protein
MQVKNIDKFGHCIVCHKYLLKNVAINGKIEEVFDANKDEAYMKLNNGSIMPISICKPCKESVNLDDPDIHKQLMEAVHEGWKLEIDLMKEDPEKYGFTPEKEQVLRRYYKDLYITGHDRHHKAGA